MAGTVTYGTDCFAFASTGATFKNIANSTSHKLSQSTKMRDISSKDSGYYNEILPGEMEWSISVDGMHATDAGIYNVQYFQNAYNNRVPIALKCQNSATGGTYGNFVPNTTSNGFSYSGSTYLSKLDLDYKMGDNVSFSATFQGTGTLYFY